MREAKRSISISIVFMIAISGLGIIITLPEGTLPLDITEKASGSFPGGDGSASNPYHISDVGHLQNMSSHLNSHFILINDIDASETSSWNSGEGFVPVGVSYNEFKGTLNGQDFNITQLTIDRPSVNIQGIFGEIGSTSIVRNVNLRSVSILASSYAGGIAGQNYGIVKNCSVSGDVGGPGETASSVGGLVGSNEGTIEYCESQARITGDNSGGIAGNNYGSIRKCRSSGNVKSVDAGSSGGVVGSSSNQGIIDNCESHASVSGPHSIGGLVGINHGTISDCHATGMVSGATSSGDSSAIGGLVGNAPLGQIKNCFSTGRISGDQSVGGLIGYIDGGQLINCYSTGSADGNNDIGGLIGFVGGIPTISESYSTGAVTGVSNLGGLIGRSFSSSFISDCFSISQVTGSSYVGGLIGSNNGNVINCYSAGSVEGVNSARGLICSNGGTVESCFWDNETSGQTESNGGTGKTTANMKKRATFSESGWSVDIWDIAEDESYPFFRTSYFGPSLPDNIPDAVEDLEYSHRIHSKTCWLPGCENTPVYKLNTDCEWLSIDSSGELSGKPTNDDIGSHWIDIMVQDLTGTSISVNYSIDVENTNDPPTILTTSIPEAVEDQLYNVMIEGEDIDPTGDTFTWEIVSSDIEFLTINSTTGWLKGMPENEDVGTFELTISASDDKGGNSWATFDFVVLDINDLPVITTENIETARQGEEYYARLFADDIDDEEPFNWYLDTNADWLSIDELTGELTGTPENSDVGTHMVNITVKDGRGGSCHKRYWIEVTNVNDPPYWFNIPSDLEIDQGNIFTFNIEAVDPDLIHDPQEKLTYSISSNPEVNIWIDKDTGEISWNVTVGPLIHYDLTLGVKISVSDGTESIGHEFNITVIPNSSPTSSLIYPSDNQKVPGEGMHLEWQGNDREGNPILYDIYLHESEVLVTTMQMDALFIEEYDGTNIPFNSTEQGVTYFWTVIPSDLLSMGACNSGVFSFKINSIPSLKDVDDHTVIAGEMFSFRVEGSDQDREDDFDIEFSLANAPMGMTINRLAMTGKIEWTPERDQVGTHTVTVKITDGLESDTISFDIMVTEEKSESSFPILAIVIPAMVIVLIAVGILLFFIWRKQSSVKGETTEDDITDNDQVSEIAEAATERKTTVEQTQQPEENELTPHDRETNR